MSILKLPVDLLEELFDRPELSRKDFCNLRLTNKALDPITAPRVFYSFTLDLDNPYCMELLVGPSEELDKAKVPHKVKQKVIDGQIIIEDNTSDSDDEEGDNKLAEQLGNQTLKDKNENAEVDLGVIGQHVKELHIRGTREMGNGTPQARDKLLEIGFGPFLEKIPNLRKVEARFTDRVFITEEWKKALESICPPDSEPDKWELHLHVKGRMDNVGDDEIYRNAQFLRNLTSLEVNAGMRYCSEDDTDKTTRIDAAMKGIAAAITNSPRLQDLEVGLGYSFDFRFDDILSKIPGDEPLNIVSLSLDNADAPCMHVDRLKNLKRVNIREPDRQIHTFTMSGPTIINRASQHDGGCILCFWTQLTKFDVPLTHISINEVCDGLISYLHKRSSIGPLENLRLWTSPSEPSCDLADAFWSAISLHGKHLKSLNVDTGYYSPYCYTPNSAASDALSQMNRLEDLSICPADEDIAGGFFIEELISSLWKHEHMKTIRPTLASPNGFKGSWCGTGALMHSQGLRKQYADLLSKCKGEGKPGFVVNMTAGYMSSLKNTWNPVEEEGEEGVWRLVNGD